HVLHIIFDFDKAISEIHRILKPGGVALVATPHISMYKPEFRECWRFTPYGLQGALTKSFGAEQVTMRAYGNSLTAAGEIRGLVVHEFTRSELEYHDIRFPVEVCARAFKKAS
ncbi:MAG: methyltransferase domain-containing protein, partial [Thermodesulfovibrionales bacterium]